MIDSKYKSINPDWIFYGGTFDPPHKGHMDSVEIARKVFSESQIVVVPAFAPPVSSHVQKDGVSSFADRVAMCVVAFDEWQNVQVSALEEDLGEPSYTVRTLRDLRAEYPSAKLAWMIGADQLVQFHNWHEPREILEMASLVVLPRPGQVKGDLLETAGKLATSLGFSISTDPEALLIKLDGGNAIFVLEENPASASSTELRTLLNAKDPGLENFLCPAVLDYIDDVGLYGFDHNEEGEV